MANRWGSLFGRPRAEPTQPAVPAVLTEAFLDMDQRQSIVESAVEASDQLFAERRMRAQWQPVLDQCYAASAAYLELTGPARPVPTAPQPPPRTVDEVTRQLYDAARAVDRFYETHRTHLEHARATLAAVPDTAAQAVEAANAARRTSEAADARYLAYPSVQAARRALDTAMTALDSALAARNPVDIRKRAAELHAAATALHNGLNAAPAAETQAQQSISSVSTRLAAVKTRFERLAPAYSALLREFNAASSADLHGNEHESSSYIDAAEAGMAQARAALRDGNPERALEMTASVRADLTRAEDLVDAVTDRLTLLRGVRENPKAKEDEVRFKLRDAQMLAVSRGLVKEWASVLDAQLDRIERVAAQLNGRHPDYWGYVSGLDAISTFISGVVARMRSQTPEGR